MRLRLIPIIALLSTPALATSPTKPPQTTSPNHAQVQGQEQIQAQDQSQSVESVSEASSDGLTASYQSDSDTLAVGLANPTTAAPVFTKCHESRGGKHVIAGSWGARVEINSDCQAFEQCMTLARTYIELGMPTQAAAQLTQCGGQPAPETLTYPVDPPEDSCLEHADRVLEACVAK